MGEIKNLSRKERRILERKRNKKIIIALAILIGITTAVTVIKTFANEDNNKVSYQENYKLTSNKEGRINMNNNLTNENKKEVNNNIEETHENDIKETTKDEITKEESYTEENNSIKEENINTITTTNTTNDNNKLIEESNSSNNINTNSNENIVEKSSDNIKYNSEVIAFHDDNEKLLDVINNLKSQGILDNDISVDFVNLEDDIVTINMNRYMMNLNEIQEATLITNLVNKIGLRFNVNYVRILVEGGTYCTDRYNAFSNHYENPLYDGSFTVSK